MNAKWKELLQKLQRPKGGFLAVWYVLTALCCAGAITFAVLGPQSLFFAVFSYVFYGLATVTFGYTVYTIVIFAPSIKAGLTRWIKKSAFGRKMLEQYGFRTIIFAFCTLIFNVAYVLLHVVLAIVYGSFWYGSLAWYYGLLVFLRSGIVFYHRKKSKNGIFDREEQARTEFRKYCVCGVSLTVIPLILLIPILQIIFLDRAFIHEGWTVIAFAAYAFYKIVMAIYNAIKAQKQSDLTVEAVRNVGLADALVSIFALQTSLLFAFSEGSNYAWANVATGSAVCVLTVAIGVFMLVKARKNGRKRKMEEKKNTTFEYTYSAPTEAEKKQIEIIRRRYEEKPKAATTAVEQIRALDAKVRNTATVWGLVFGVVGCLTFGFGLTLILEWSKWIWGIVFMAVGCPPMVFAYPIHQWKLKKGKEKYGAEILRLSEQALQNKE